MSRRGCRLGTGTGRHSVCPRRGVGGPWSGVDRHVARVNLPSSRCRTRQARAGP